MNKRLILKGIIWETLGLLTLYVLTSNVEISLIYTVTRIITYYVYHKIWKNICLWK